MSDRIDQAITAPEFFVHCAHLLLTPALFVHDRDLHNVIAFLLFTAVAFALDKLGKLSFFAHFCAAGLVAGVVYALTGCGLYYTGLASDAISLGFGTFLFLDFAIVIMASGGIARVFSLPAAALQYIPLILMDVMRAPGPWFVGYLSGILMGRLYRFGALCFLVPGRPFFRRVEKRLFGDRLRGLRYLPAVEERTRVTMDDELYSPDRFGDFSCSFARKPASHRPVCFRRQICCSGEVFRVSKLSYAGCLASVCIPSSIEVIERPGLRLERGRGIIAIAFEWGSQLRRMDPGALYDANIRSFCVPASLRMFPNSHCTFSSSLGALCFEPGSQMRQLSWPLVDSDHSTFTLLPASLEHIDGDAFCRGTVRCNDRYGVEAGNRHFTVAGGALMNISRTSVIRYFDDTPILSLDSMVEELEPFSFAHLSLRSFACSEPSRLRIIGPDAFAFCNNIRSITIPSTVQVIAKRVFLCCGALEVVHIGTGSRLWLIEQEAFEGDRNLQPVDVPWFTVIRCAFQLMATVFDEDGSKRRRVRFSAGKL